MFKKILMGIGLCRLVLYGSELMGRFIRRAAMEITDDGYLNDVYHTCGYRTGYDVNTEKQKKKDTEVTGFCQDVVK